MFTTDKYFDKLTEMGVEIKEKILNLLREKKIESINLYPYNDQIGLISYKFYGCDNNGDAVGYNLDVIEMKNGMPIFEMSDNDGYNSTFYKINDFNTLEALYVLDTLENLFSVCETDNIPILKKGEEFD